MSVRVLWTEPRAKGCELTPILPAGAFHLGGAVRVSPLLLPIKRFVKNTGLSCWIENSHATLSDASSIGPQ